MLKYQSISFQVLQAFKLVQIPQSLLSFMLFYIPIAHLICLMDTSEKNINYLNTIPASIFNIQYFFINRNGLCDVWDMLPVMVVEASNVHTFKHLNKVDFSKQIFYIFLCVLFYVSYCMIFSHLYSLVCCTWSNLALCVLQFYH